MSEPSRHCPHCHRGLDFGHATNCPQLEIDSLREQAGRLAVALRDLRANSSMFLARIEAGIDGNAAFEASIERARDTIASSPFLATIHMARDEVIQAAQADDNARETGSGHYIVDKTWFIRLSAALNAYNNALASLTKASTGQEGK